MAWLLLHLSTFPYTRIVTVYRSMYSNVFCSKPFLFGVINRTHLFFTASSVLWCKYSTSTFLFYKVSIFANLHILNFNLGLI